MTTAIMLGAPAAFASNYVLDSNFNSPSGGSSFTTYLGGQSLGPWSVIGAGVDLIGGYWQAPTMNGGSVDLDGNAPGGITQAIDGLNPGGRYDLSFYLSGNPDGSPTTKTVEVSIGSVVDKVFTYTLTGANTHSDMAYELITLPFIAGSSNTLSFTSLDGDRSPYGAVIGGASVIAAPEPSTWAMMGLGFAGLAFAGRRARRTAISVA
jgi:choice-of-anchor C domain-containing protein